MNQGGYTLEAALLAEPFASLELAIADHPRAGVNYLLRGEHLLARGWPTEAAADFEQAVALFRGRVETDDWDSVGHALLARAESGLAKALRNL